VVAECLNKIVVRCRCIQLRWSYYSVSGWTRAAQVKLWDQWDTWAP